MVSPTHAMFRIYTLEFPSQWINLLKYTKKKRKFFLALIMLVTFQP